MNRVIVFTFILFFSIFFSSFADTDKILDDLEKNLSEIETIQADFVQVKSLAIFNDQLVIEGTIYLEKPDLFAWKVKTPLVYSLVIDKRRILQWDAESNQIQKISLQEKPIFNTIISQLRKWFYGQYRQLLESYAMNKLKSSPLVLEFRPKESLPTADIIDKLTITFREDLKYIETIEIEEQSGDKTRLKFFNVKLNKSLAATVWEIK